jgi:hypothetical protein
VAVDTLTVVPQNSSGIPQFSRALGVGSCSPTTTSAFGNSPLVNLVYDYFGFTILRFDGHLDNSSVTSFDITPSGGSTITFNVDTYAYYSSSDETQFASSDDDQNLVAGTTYTIRLYSGSTNVNTERVTLERRTPTKFSDFYGATRNVPPVSGAFKLSWLKNAEKYDHGSAMTSVQFTTGFITYTGYSSLISPNFGSFTSTTVSDIINYYQGATIKQIYQFSSSQSPSTILIIFTMDKTSVDTNSQWYKVTLTPTGGGSVITFYREDLTYSRSGARHTWTKDYGTPQLANGTTNYNFELHC